MMNQEAPRLILMSGTSFRKDLVMKIFLWPFYLSTCICLLIRLNPRREHQTGSGEPSAGG